MTEGYGCNPTFQATKYSLLAYRIEQNLEYKRAGGNKSKRGKAKRRWEGGKGQHVCFLASG